MSNKTCAWPAVALCVLFLGCRPDRPNILFLVIDSLRADHLGFAGYGPPTSPHLDSLAACGAAFTCCTAQAPFTTASVPSMMTGRYPTSASLPASVTLPGYAAPLPAVQVGRGVCCLPALLRPHGYVSVMISASGQVKHCIVGLKEQFDLVDEEVECFSGDCAGRVNERTLAWLSKAPAEPWFYYIHYMDVHHPYDAPRDWAGRFSESYGKLPAPAFHGERKRRWENPEPEVLDHVVGMYDGEIAYLDSQVGQLLGSLKARGLTDNLLIVVASDHGEELCERGGYGHGQTLYEEQTRCPLIFVWPGQIPPTVTSEKPVQNVDIVPTLLDLLGVEPPPEIEGASLVPCFRGDRPALPVFSERRGVSVRQGRWKLWHGDHGIVRLFDLSGDPSESANLARAEPDTLRALQAVLTNWRSRLRPPPRPSGRPRAARPDPAALARLHTLGYHG